MWHYGGSSRRLWWSPTCLWLLANNKNSNKYDTGAKGDLISECRILLSSQIEAETKWQPFFQTIFSIFLNENVSISTKISLKFVLKGPINNMPTLVQIMAWCRPGDKPLSEPIAVSLLTHICVSQPQWVNRLSHCCFARNKFYLHTTGNLVLFRLKDNSGPSIKWNLGPLLLT